MSRIGKTPIEIPSGVTCTEKAGLVRVEGPKGKLEYQLPHSVKMAQVEGRLEFTSLRKDREARALYGTARAMVNNMIIGVSTGWQRRLELSGVGYTAQQKGNDVVLAVGLSHEVTHTVPAGVSCKVEKTAIELESVDKQLVGNFAARIRKSQPPEPYLGKGIRYANENVRRKAGKTGKA